MRFIRKFKWNNLSPFTFYLPPSSNSSLNHAGILIATLNLCFMSIYYLSGCNPFTLASVSFVSLLTRISWRPPLKIQRTQNATDTFQGFQIAKNSALWKSIILHTFQLYWVFFQSKLESAATNEAKMFKFHKTRIGWSFQVYYRQRTCNQSSSHNLIKRRRNFSI